MSLETALRPAPTTFLRPAAEPPGDEVATATQAGEYLAFRIGSEEYAIDILQVQEIRSFEAPTRIAQAPDGVIGVLNLRGVIVPVVDLRGPMGATPGFDSATVTIVLNLKGATVGAVVDAVCDVVELAGEQIRPAPQVGGHGTSSTIAGIGCVVQGDHRRMLILLDIERLIAQVDAGLVAVAHH